MRSWPDKIDRKYSSQTVERFKLRDRALVCCTYLMALRISEVLRLKKKDFTLAQGFIEVKKIRLSKSDVTLKLPDGAKKKVQRKHANREGWLPLTGERAELTKKQ